MGANAANAAWYYRCLAWWFACMLRLGSRVRHPLFWLRPMAWVASWWHARWPLDIERTRFPFLEYITPPVPGMAMRTLPAVAGAPCLHVHAEGCEEAEAQAAVQASACPMAVFYIHGGGFVSGDATGFAGVAGHLAALLDADVFVPDYTLAPENTVDGMVSQCEARWAALQRDPAWRGRAWVLAADSAGAYLALAMLQKNTMAMSRVSSVLLLSPITRLFTTYKRARMPHPDPTVPPAWLAHIYAMVHACSSQRMPFCLTRRIVIPHGARRPVLYIIVSRDELLNEDSKLLMEWGVQNGLQVLLHEVAHMPHSFPLYYPVLEAGRTALAKWARCARNLAWMS